MAFLSEAQLESALLEQLAGLGFACASDNQATVVLGVSPTLAQLLLPGLFETCLNTLQGVPTDLPSANSSSCVTLWPAASFRNCAITQLMPRTER